MVEHMGAKPYDPIRGFRYPKGKWPLVKRLAKAKHQKPSDYIRHALDRAIAADVAAGRITETEAA